MAVIPNEFDRRELSDVANDAINFVFDTFSNVVGNIASNVAPLTAGLLPAYLTYTHIADVLTYDTWVAWAGAITVEFLGLGAGNELMKVWHHNKYVAEKETDRLPVLNATLAAAWYILIMIVFNIILEAAPNSMSWRIAAVALFATLAVPGYMLVAGRTLRIQWQKQTEARLAETNELKVRLEENEAEAELEIERLRMANERELKVAEFQAKKEMADLRHRQKMEALAYEHELAKENERANPTNEHVRSFPDQRTNATNATNERANEILDAMNDLYRERGMSFSQADVCRLVQYRRTGSEEGFETLKGYVNRIAKTWQPPQEATNG